MENFLFLLYNKIVFQFRKNALFQFLERLITQFHSTRNNTKDRQSKKSLIGILDYPGGLSPQTQNPLTKSEPSA